MAQLDKPFDIKWKRSERMVGRKLAGEFVLVPLAQRGADLTELFTMNATGTFIWENLSGEKTGEEIIKLLTEAYEVTLEEAQSDYSLFIQELGHVRAIEENA